jgi:type IV pilus assembly protein PilY1
MSKSLRSLRSAHLGWVMLTGMLTLTGGNSALAQTTLADTPVYSTSNVPANLMMTLSVEFPTGTVAAYGNATSYSSSSTFLGYFDFNKCYTYDSTDGYFTPVSPSTITGPVCTGYWSGNMLNWLLMTSLDEFRQALTGGNRVIDTTSNTVLERSLLNSQSSTSSDPNRQIGTLVNVEPSTVVGDTNYSSLANVYFEVAGQGTTFIISNNSGFRNSGTTNIGTTNHPNNINNKATTYNAKVQVCVSGMLEANCNSAHKTTDYVGAGVYNKPEGLIQQNYTRIRVGASAYGFLDGNGAANGVVRALLRDNGPTTYNGYGTRQTNANSEWSATTGIFSTNPYSSDSSIASAPGGGTFTASGAINYLNQFGYENGYETFDTIADLYWSSLAYFMKVPLDPSYYTGMTASNSLDTNFPVYTTNLNDPIQYTCQSNAIVTIGDAHTWYDTRVPSSGGPTPNSSNQAALPVVNGADAAGYVTALGDLPLIEANGTASPASVTMAQLRQSGPNATTSTVVTTPLGSEDEPDDTTSPTYNMAGLAYFAHTQDIRSDLTNKQTVSTYTVDVLEPGSYDGASGDEIYDPAHFSTSSGAAGPDMYWLAAKYGGFDDVNNNGVPASELTWHTNASTGTGLYPDNYFPGNRPDLLQTGLTQIFNNVASTASQSASSPGITATRTLTNITPKTAPFFASAAGYPVYTTQYTPVSWTGDVDGIVTTTTSGTVTPVVGSTTWDAQSKLDTLTQATSASGSTIVGWNTGRRIVSWNGSAGIPFRYTSLSAAEQTALNATGSGPAFLNWMRGDKSNEGTLFRQRTHLLGDIVDSSAVLVQGALSPSYTESANPGYTNFTTTVQGRQPVVYVGGNDGMLHAFEADFLTATSANSVTGGGSELFAYVPSVLYNGPTSTPLVNGLPALANLNGVSTNNFAHHFYVDSTPQVADVDFTYTSSGTFAPTSSAASAEWNTILVGGLGKGGKGIYALNITAVPQAVDTTSSAKVESSEAGKVMWEFTDTDMGYTYGAPLIVKTRKYGWVVVETSGYDNTGAGQDGHGVLYIINVQTGALIQKLDTGVGTTTNPAGLAQATGFTQNVADGTIEQIYAGDLLGNVWRFDLSEPAIDSSGNATPAYPSPTLFATLTDPSGNPQPITTAPRIEESVSANDLTTIRWVFVGTGKFLDISDLSNTQQQTLYAIMDGSGPTPSTTGLPVTRSNLTADTNLLTGEVIPATSFGWYYDLTNSAGTNGGTERVVVSPDAVAGIGDVVWATLVPSSDPCSLSSNIYVTNFNGESQLVGSSGAMAYLSISNAATTGASFIQNSSGQVAILAGSSTNSINIYNIQPPSLSNNLNRYNWREILN